MRTLTAIIIVSVIMFCKNDNLCAAGLTELELADEGKCFCSRQIAKGSIPGIALELDIRSSGQKRGKTSNLDGLTPDLINHLSSVGISPENVIELHIKNLDSDYLDFIIPFNQLRTLDLYTSHTYDGLAHLNDKLDVSKLELIDIRGNHIGHATGELNKLLRGVPSTCQILISNEDVDILNHPQFGIGRSWRVASGLLPWPFTSSCLMTHR